MKLYAMTGGATGIGAATREKLLSAGCQVINIDIDERADIRADLSKPEEREKAAAALREQASNGLDGFIPCAGVGPHIDPPSIVAKINYFAAIMSCEAALPLLEKKQGSLVLISSNSAPMDNIDEELIAAMLAGDEDAACKIADESNGAAVYASSKNALVRWMRNNTQGLCKRNIRANAVAPGMTKTPLTIANRADPRYSKLMDQFEASLPIGRQGRPDEIASAICFLLSEQASFCVSSVLFIDGGTDALLRPTAI